MTIKVLSSNAASVSIPNLGFSNKRCIPMVYSAKSLPPNTNFTLWINNVDMTWACKQEGKRMGAGVSSDSSGKIAFQIFSEFEAGGSGPAMTRATTVVLKDGNGIPKSTSIINELLIPRN